MYWFQWSCAFAGRAGHPVLNSCFLENHEWDANAVVSGERCVFSGAQVSGRVANLTFEVSREI